MNAFPARMMRYYSIQDLLLPVWGQISYLCNGHACAAFDTEFEAKFTVQESQMFPQQLQT